MTSTRGRLVGARLGSRQSLVLWVSLAANLFFAGLVGAHMLFFRPPPPPGLGGFIAHLTRSLPPPDAGRFHDVMDRERPWYEQAHAAMEQARSYVAASIAQEPYNEAEVRQRLQEWRTRWSEGSDRFGDSLLVAIRTLSPEGRRSLAAALREPHH